MEHQSLGPAAVRLVSRSGDEGLYRQSLGLIHHLREFAAKFEKGIKSFTYDQKRKIIDMLVERVEISEEGPRMANVLLRFDPKEIASRIPGVEPSLLKQKPKKQDLDAAYNVSGAIDGI